MLSVAYKSFMLSVIMLNAIMLSVVAPDESAYFTRWQMTACLPCLIGNPYRRAMLGTVDLLVPTSLYQLILILKTKRDLPLLQNKLP
jgi:hypothetical protein